MCPNEYLICLDYLIGLVQYGMHNVARRGRIKNAARQLAEGADGYVQTDLVFLSKRIGLRPPVISLRLQSPPL